MSFCLKICKEAEPDFKGVMLGGRAVMFEAKSTGTGRLNKDRVLPEQVKKLDSYTTLGAHCFIVATFDGLRVYRIPWTVWRSMKQRYGRNYVTPRDVRMMVKVVLAHRMRLRLRYQGEFHRVETVLDSILDAIPMANEEPGA